MLAVVFLAGLSCSAQVIPAAVSTDPPIDKAHPAAMASFQIPSHGVGLNALMYIAAGAAPHPVVVLLHGFPGNEKNLDLAQAVRRAGWTVVTVNYRGSWGSAGNFRFAHNLEDAQATLSFIRSPENAKRLSIDPARIALGGHSMGGWVTAETLAHDSNLLGAVVISSGDFGAIGLQAQQNRAAVIANMNDNRETLAGVTGESMADELKYHGKDWSFKTLAPELIHRNLLVLYSDDFVKADSLELIKDVKAAGGKTIAEKYVVTDHSWSDHRIALESLVIDWLGTLPGPR